jgi:hypothetical protein
MKLRGSLITQSEMSGRRNRAAGARAQLAGAGTNGVRGAGRKGENGAGEFPEAVRASVAVRCGEYDARRLRSQREVIRDVMLAAAESDTWLTLGELRALTRFGEASISAQLRHLRKSENGGYDVGKQRRGDGAGAALDGRGEFVWEYRIVRAGRVVEAAI